MSSKRKMAEQQLIDAVLLNDLQTVRVLLDAGVDVNARDDEHQETCLMLARKEELVRLLLERGADVTAKDDRGVTVLHVSQYPALLLAAGADANVRDKEGETPLLHAVWSADFDRVELLIANGADPSIADNDGETPLSLASRMGLTNLIEVLRTAGVSE